jgi:L-lactate utilization protein LutB
MAFESDEARRAYFREYNKGWYRRHRERLLEERKQHNQELRQWLRQYKSKLCCIKCGESHPACLQFHHRDRENKSFGIGSFIGRTHLSIKRLKKEIDKCDVLCGNCHAILHWREMHSDDD